MIDKSLNASTLVEHGSAVDFSLPYRIKLSDNRIVQCKDIKPDQFAWLESVTRSYETFSEAERQVIYNFFDNDDKRYLLHLFSEKTTASYKATNDESCLFLAMVALLIEEGRFDPRDFLVSLSAICRAAKPDIIKKLAEKVIPLSNNEVATWNFTQVKNTCS